MNWEDAIKRAAVLFSNTLEQRSKDIREHAEGKYSPVLTEIILYGPTRARDTRFLGWLGQTEVPWMTQGVSILNDRSGAYAAPIGPVVDRSAKMTWLEQVGIVLAVDQMRRYLDRAVKKLSEMPPGTVPDQVAATLNVSGDFFKNIREFTIAYDWVIDTGHSAGVTQPATTGPTP